VSLAIVTATTNAMRAGRCIESWLGNAKTDPTLVVVENGTEAHPYRGVVPAFRAGVDRILDATDAEILCCFHDDLEIREPGWDLKVQRLFDRRPACGLAGFGGALALGASTLYTDPYAPVQLARAHFRSNLVDAETHGIRSLITEPVVCLDGFSQIGRRAFFEGWVEGQAFEVVEADGPVQHPRPWTFLETLGVVHHFYDGMLGCLARRLGWEAWYLPVSCRHYGGQTAVGDPGYQAWAEARIKGGDRGFWEAAHRIGYDEFRDVLPLRLPADPDQG